MIVEFDYVIGDQRPVAVACLGCPNGACAAVAVTGRSRMNARCLQLSSHSSATKYACLVASLGCAAEVAGKTAHCIDVSRSGRCGCCDWYGVYKLVRWYKKS